MKSPQVDVELLFPATRLQGRSPTDGNSGDIAKEAEPFGGPEAKSTIPLCEI